MCEVKRFRYCSVLKWIGTMPASVGGAATLLDTEQVGGPSRAVARLGLRMGSADAGVGRPRGGFTACRYPICSARRCSSRSSR